MANPRLANIASRILEVKNVPKGYTIFVISGSFAGSNKVSKFSWAELRVLAQSVPVLGQDKPASDYPEFISKKISQRVSKLKKKIGS